MTENDINIKVTLIGNPSVGKTCIINKYCKNVFDQNVDSTLGANYSLKKLEKNGKHIRLDLWDTAGQERYRAIGRHFYKESYIVCLVYDITNRDSFIDLKNIWYKELLEYGEKYKIIGLIGNKVDKYLEEKVSEEEGKKYAKEINALFKRTSALDGTGIQDLFEGLVDLYLKETNDKMGQMVIKDKSDNIKIKTKSDEKHKKSSMC